MKKLIAVLAVALVLVAVSASSALAGQPNASCEDPGANPPPGFSTGGFANAEEHYAGSPGTPSAANGSSHAVSQYDIACLRGPKR
jgi:hypothetical protein